MLSYSKALKYALMLSLTFLRLAFQHLTNVRKGRYEMEAWYSIAEKILLVQIFCTMTVKPYRKNVLHFLLLVH